VTDGQRRVKVIHRDGWRSYRLLHDENARRLDLAAVELFLDRAGVEIRDLVGVDLAKSKSRQIDAP
jgi:hypothetical protein